MISRDYIMIYIIDKNHLYRNIIAEFLKSIEIYNYREFTSGEECFSNNGPEPHLVILENDLGEGHWSGIEFMEEYQRVHKNTSFIFMSSNSRVEVAVETIRKGATDYIVKSRSGLGRLARHIESLILSRA
jgi:two-component system, OmpR family, response regulator